MKILVVSDSHLTGNTLQRVTYKYMNKVDLMIHCGDSSLPIDDPILRYYDIVVRGNHDDADFPPYQVKDHICVTHGHLYHVYNGYEELIQLCKENNCHYCFHGHTHIPTYQYHEGIHFLNPGSLMINRAHYAHGSYAIVDITENSFEYEFYHDEKDTLLDKKKLEKESEEFLNYFKRF